jgi:multicomponent Na+:H+ antiporter subunit G
MSVAIEIVVGGLMGLGALAVLVASIGLLRMPDLFARMQASSKAATLGAILTLAASSLYFADLSVAVQTLLIAIFLALTLPVGAHVIARAAHQAGARMADPGAVDELAGNDGRRS